ncbi:putative quorum-quenching lactonase YtnP [Phycisphaerae bacterium RAS1]|nr:putative quorum-quenching lactonase YtnP [Phycisphaerae bacterium RAS1]
MIGTGPQLDLGGCTATLLHGGKLRLDGGAMFGIIPKALWSRGTPCDEQNRIQLACNCLLIEWPGSARRVIIETGHGAKYTPKDQGLFAIDPSTWLATSLHEAGIDQHSITDVILTHLHFDHAGGLTCGAGGPDETRVRPTFANARVHVQRLEFTDARSNFGIMTMTYREENYSPVDAAGAWRLLDGDQEVLPGIRALCTPGHTRGHQSLLVSGRQRSLLFLGDVLPTAQHVGAPYNMAYDVLPLENRATKQRMLRRAAEQDWLIVLDHEPQQPLVRAAAEGRWFRLIPA